MAAPGYPAGGDQKFGPPPPYFEPGAQPPQAGFVNPGHVHTTTVITSEPVAPTHILVSGDYGLPRSHNSCRIQCPHCRADVSTSVNYETGMMAHLFALILCVIVCWPCCLIPYCVDGCKDTTHQCPACGRHLGTVKRM